MSITITKQDNTTTYRTTQDQIDLVEFLRKNANFLVGDENILLHKVSIDGSQTYRFREAERRICVKIKYSPLEKLSDGVFQLIGSENEASFNVLISSQKGWFYNQYILKL